MSSKNAEVDRMSIRVLPDPGADIDDMIFGPGDTVPSER